MSRQHSESSVRDLDFYNFVVQVGFSALLFLLCGVNITFPQQGRNRLDPLLFWGGITNIISYWMKPPGATKEKGDISIDGDSTTVINESNKPK